MSGQKHNAITRKHHVQKCKIHTPTSTAAGVTILYILQH